MVVQEEAEADGAELEEVVVVVVVADQGLLLDHQSLVGHEEIGKEALVGVVVEAAVEVDPGTGDEEDRTLTVVALVVAYQGLEVQPLIGEVKQSLPLRPQCPQ